MPLIRPFKAVVYNEKAIKDVSAVVAPPYDIIPPELQEELYRKDPCNVVRLILGKIKKGDTAKDNRYTRAKKFFESWCAKNTLTQDESDAIYIYSQRYEVNGKKIDRIGFISLMQLSLGKKKAILPHENTLFAPKQDRMELMKHVKANLSPIFLMYDDGTHSLVKMFRKFCSKKSPFIDIEIGKVRQRVWRMDDPALIRKTVGFMRKKDLFIADGHHRYEVACNYAREIADKNVPAELKASAKYMMAYFVESDENMLTVLPTHRVIKDIGGLDSNEMVERLRECFEVTKVKTLSAALLKLDALKRSCAFVVYHKGPGFLVIKLKDFALSDRVIKDKPKDWKRLDVSVLHKFLLEHVLGIKDDENNIEYVKDPKKTISLIDSGKFKVAFLLNPTKVSQIKRVARIGEKMPKKSTYFDPKPLSGIVINKLG